MGLTDRVEPWARRFQRAVEPVPDPDPEPARASLRAHGDDDAEAPVRRGGRFARRRPLQKQER
jgi:hypothetical protein